MIAVAPASTDLARWAALQVAAHHYLRKAPDRRSRPFCHVVTLDGEPVGCLFWGRPEATRCYAGRLTYGSAEDVREGRAAFDRWEVLNLSRVWLSPDVQQGGRLYGPDRLPGYTDRAGVWRSSLASTAIRLGLARVGFDYLIAHPPCFVEQPYAIRAVLSYCDTSKHRGTIYKAAGFQFARTNADGIETWWTARVKQLNPEQHQQVRERSRTSPRSRRIREGRRSLFDGVA